MLAVLIVLPLDLLSMKVCVLLTAMPAANTTVMLAGKYDRDPAFASELVMTSTLLSLFSIPLISGLGFVIFKGFMKRVLPRIMERCV